MTTATHPAAAWVVAKAATATTLQTTPAVPRAEATAETLAWAEAWVKIHMVVAPPWEVAWAVAVDMVTTLAWAQEVDTVVTLAWVAVWVVHLATAMTQWAAAAASNSKLSFRASSKPACLVLTARSCRGQFGGNSGAGMGSSEYDQNRQQMSQHGQSGFGSSLEQSIEGAAGMGGGSSGMGGGMGGNSGSGGMGGGMMDQMANSEINKFVPQGAQGFVDREVSSTHGRTHA